MKSRIFKTSLMIAAILVVGCGSKNDSPRTPKQASTSTKSTPSAESTSTPATGATLPTTSTEGSVSGLATASATSTATPSGPVAESIATWVERMLKAIDESRDQNPLAAKERLAGVQAEVFNRAGFQLRCDDSFFSGYKEYEMKQCYGAIKALLKAIHAGLAPANPRDGFAIDEIVIVKTGSKIYEPIYGRFGLEVHHLVTTAEWPALLKSQIDGFARQKQLQRAVVAEDKLGGLTSSLFVEHIENDESGDFSLFEKGVHLLEQVITLEAALRANQTTSTKEGSTLSGKAYQKIRLATRDSVIFEDDGELVVAVDARSTNPMKTLQHLVAQANRAGQALRPLQLDLLGRSATNEDALQSRFVFEFMLQREKIATLQEDIQTRMLGGRVRVTVNLDRSKNCRFFVFCQPKGTTVREAYGFLMNLREALSGGPLENMKISEIRVERSGTGVRESPSDQHLTFAAKSSAKGIYRGLWLTTPAGEAFDAELALVKARSVALGI
jgi:hypothetical protein